jgi:hypothetical protein
MDYATGGLSGWIVEHKRLLPGLDPLLGRMTLGNFKDARFCISTLTEKAEPFCRKRPTRSNSKTRK